MTQNKFMQKYPQLWSPKIGDKVKIVKLLDISDTPVPIWVYSIGDKGEIVWLCNHNVVEVLFSNGESYQTYLYEIVHDSE